MSDGRDRRSAGDGGRRKRRIHSADGSTSSWVFGGTWLLLALSVICVSGPWAGFHGVLFAGFGLLMILFPPQVTHPRAWWLLALLFVVCASAAFLPAEWFGIPEWRKNLESLGLETGDRVVIQTEMAAESLILFAIMLLGGLWLAGHRASSAQLRLWAFVFTVGVAVSAVLARIMQNAGWNLVPEHYGFFPNRNHMATYLVMGAICGLGCVLQALRDKSFYMLAASLVAASVCLWALAAWSISRAGVVLVLIGLLLWLPMLGRQYLGRHGLWAIGLILLAAVGFFLTTESTVRERLSKTVEIAGDVFAPKVDPLSGDATMASGSDLDFRIPTFLDTLEMIGQYPWTGIGGGQYYYVFPQYRKRTIIAQDADSYHPESDWLWMAAETGVPATLALLALVILAFWKSLKGVLAGRDRALRSACLVAALVVFIHGFFDVPGHRISIAWSAAFLFALSLHPPNAGHSPSSPRKWPSRVGALGLLTASFFLIRAQWLGGPEPATTTANTAITKAKLLYQEDLALQKSAAAEGREHQPDPAEDKLEQALRILDQAKYTAPLNREIRRHEAFLAFHFDDKHADIAQAFAIDLALNPHWVDGPLRQAQAWAPTAPQNAADSIHEALRRAAIVDSTDPENRFNSARTTERIRHLARKFPVLDHALHISE